MPSPEEWSRLIRRFVRCSGSSPSRPPPSHLKSSGFGSNSMPHERTDLTLRSPSDRRSLHVMLLHQLASRTPPNRR